MAEIRDRIVYLVEDDDALRRTTGRMLQASGCIVRDFDSGESFLEAINAKEPACVLLDIRMAGMSGLQVQATLAQRGVTMPVIMLTGSADVADAVLAMKTGATDYIQKPYSREGLVAALEAAFDRLDQQRRHDSRVNEAVARLAVLSRREREVLEKLAEGLQNKVVAYQLGLSARTVEAYRATLMKKLGVRSLPEALRLCVEAGELGAGEASGREDDGVAPPEDAAAGGLLRAQRSGS